MTWPRVGLTARSSCSSRPRVYPSVAIVDCRDGIALADVGPGLRRAQRQSANPSGRVNRPVARVKDRSVKAAG